MSDIDKLEKKLASLKTKASFDSLLPKASSWLSKKLLSMLAIVACLIWFGRENITLVINGIIFLSAIYLIVQGVNDAVHSVCDAWTRRKVIDAMAADGLDETEKKSLGITTKTEVISE